MPLFVTVTIYEIVFDNKIVAIYTFMFDYEYKFFGNNTTDINQGLILYIIKCHKVNLLETWSF